MDAWMYGYMDEWMYGRMDALMKGCMAARMNGCMDAWIHGRMDTWMNGFIRIYNDYKVLTAFINDDNILACIIKIKPIIAIILQCIY